MRRILCLLLVLCLSLPLTLAASGESVFTPGTYEGAAAGYGGDVTVSVTVDEKNILAVEVTAAGETPGISDPAIDKLPALIVEKQTIALDTVAGCTFTSSAILEAAKATYVDRFVHSLPDGYDTVLDDEGSSVSAGEKQLLTIARAFLADPTILILDEATSSVDTRTEVLIQHAMAALRSQRTSFVIAHRLSTIRDADTILVMEAGSIVEQGHHADLLARDGAYAALYNAQFAAAAVDLDEP